MRLSTVVSSPSTMTTSVISMQLPPSADARWSRTVDEPLTPGRVSLSQVSVVPTPPRTALSVAVAAWTCSLQSSLAMMASVSSEATGRPAAIRAPGAPPQPPSAVPAMPPAMAPNMPPLFFFLGVHFCPADSALRSLA
jgi:hypothetical protein